MKKNRKKGKHLTVFSIKKKSAMGINEKSRQDPGNEHELVERVAEKLEKAARTPKKANLHIIARGEHWIIKREGALKAYRVCDTKDEAIKNAKEMLAKGTAEHIIIHFPDGTVARRI